jgi:twitching motility protein PilT
MSVNIRKLLDGMIRVGASDMHLKVGLPPMIRLHGHLHPVEHPPLTTDDTEEVNSFMIPDHCHSLLEKNGTADYSFGLSVDIRFRINCYHQRGVKSLAIRRLTSDMHTLEELGLPTQLYRLAEIKRGLVLLTGVTGSGKSTTLSALVHKVNQTRREHIITIEDPIEFIYTDDKCVIDQVEVNQDVANFKIALRAALRQDPDIILLGELRDRETVETAMHCVETGHLVFSTLHTPDCPQTLSRVSHFFPREEHQLIFDQMAKNVQGVVCQRLLRNKTGKGRIPCCEIMFNNPIVKKLITEQRIEDLVDVLKSGQDGMQTFDMAMVGLVKSEQITFEQGNELADDPASFRRLMKGIKAGGDGGGLIGSS